MKRYQVLLNAAQIKAQFKDALVYEGEGIEIQDSKKISIRIDDEQIEVDLNSAITNKQWLNSLDVTDIKNICELCNAQITFFPSGSFFAKSKISFPLDVRSLYFTWIINDQRKILISFAYDEIQPSVYLGYLNSVIEVDRA